MMLDRQQEIARIYRDLRGEEISKNFAEHILEALNEIFEDVQPNQPKDSQVVLAIAIFCEFALTSRKKVFVKYLLDRLYSEKAPPNTVKTVITNIDPDTGEIQRAYRVSHCHR